MMFVSLILTLLISCLICLVFSSGIYFFPVVFAQIILKIEILSLFKSINPLGIITIDFVLFICTLLLCYKNIKWQDSIKNIQKNIKNCVQVLYNSFKLDKTLLILFIGFLFLFCISFFLCAFCSVNEPDALSYHVYRAFIWADKGYIHHFVTSDARNLVMPINSEIIYSWIYALTNNDLGLGFPSFFGWLFAIGNIWGILKEYRYSTRQILWCVFILSSFTGIIAQISSTQTDLLTGSFLLFSFYSFIKYLKYDKMHMLYFSTLGMALACGIKSTGVIGSIVLLITFCILCANSFKKILKFLLFLFINFLIFSSYNYVLNFIDFLNPLGSNASVEAHRFWGGPSIVLANFIRYFFQLIDFSGFKNADILSMPFIYLQNSILSILHIDSAMGVNIKFDSNFALAEQTVGYGILGFLVFIPALIVSITAKRIPLILRILGVLFFINILILSFTISYMMYNIRFIACFIVLSSPVLVLLYYRKNNALKFIAASFALFYMLYVSTHLVQRPFFKIIKSYQKEQKPEKFLDNFRCLRYDYLKSESGSACGLRDYIDEKYGKYEHIAFFPSHGLLILPIHLKLKNKADILLLNRLEEYNMAKYELLIISSPVQKVWNFYKDEKISSRCTYFARKDRDKKEVEKDVFRYVSMADCVLYYEDMDNIGFKLDSVAKISEPHFGEKLIYSFWVKKN